MKSIGLIEVSGVTAAIDCLDIMCKSADVEFVTWERKLGGRLVTVVVEGQVSAVVGVHIAAGLNASVGLKEVGLSAMLPGNVVGGFSLNLVRSHCYVATGADGSEGLLLLEDHTLDGNVCRLENGDKAVIGC